MGAKVLYLNKKAAIFHEATEEEKLNALAEEILKDWFEANDQYGLEPEIETHKCWRSVKVLMPLYEVCEQSYEESYRFHEEIVLEHDPELTECELSEAIHDSMSEASDDLAYVELNLEITYHEDIGAYICDVQIEDYTTDQPYFRQSSVRWNNSCTVGSIDEIKDRVQDLISRDGV